MSDLTDYQEARERVEALRPQWTRDPVHNAVVTVKCVDLARLLDGPPVTAEEIGETIFMAHEDYRSPLSNARYAAQAVLALLQGTKT